jgi:CrcB protein
LTGPVPEERMGSEAQAIEAEAGPDSRRRDPRVVAAVALGGALGAPARYGISAAVHVTPGTFPWGTFWTNVSGSLALGFLLAIVLRRFPATRYVRPFLASGFLGSYTTYSTFAVETDLLIRNGRTGVALAYVTASFAAGFVAASAGGRLGRGRLA